MKCHLLGKTVSLTSLENWEPHQASIFYQSYLSLVWDNHENVEFIFFEARSSKKKKPHNYVSQLPNVDCFLPSVLPSFLQVTVRSLTSRGANG